MSRMQYWKFRDELKFARPYLSTKLWQMQSELAFFVQSAI